MDTEHIPQKHWSTPQKARIMDITKIIGTNSLRSPNGTLLTKTRLFRQNNVPLTTAKRILKSQDPRTLHNSKIRKETRGRKPLLTEQDIRAIERLIWTHGQAGRVLTWESLAHEAGVNVSAHTLQRQFKTKGYRRCVACRKSFITPDIAARRVKFARDMLAKYPEPQDWYKVRFTNEVHLGYGPQGRIYVTRKPGEVNCADCVQHEHEPRREDEKKVHGWGAVGYDFKSPLYSYDAGNSNGAMTQQVYITLLQEEVAQWPSNVVLEEDGASGHGLGKKSIITKWKQDNNVTWYHNCPYSPDLAPIENAWLAPKAWLRKFAHWDDNTVWEVAQEGWEALSQKKINYWVESMPQRLRDVIQLEGQMTAW